MNMDNEEYNLNKLMYCSCLNCGHINKVISHHDINYNCKKCGSLLENSLTYKTLNSPSTSNFFNAYESNKTIDKIAISMLMQIK